MRDACASPALHRSGQLALGKLHDVDEIGEADSTTPGLGSLIEFKCSAGMAGGWLMEKLAHPRITIWRDLYVTARTTAPGIGPRARQSCSLQCLSGGGGGASMRGLESPRALEAKSISLKTAEFGAGGLR